MIKRKHLLIIIFLVLIILFLFVFCSLINKHDVINKIIKKEENKDVITREKTVENGISNNEKVIDKLLEILIENKVTPITTKDVITDLKLDPSMIYSRM